MYLLQPGSFPLKIETTKPSLVCRLRGKYPLGLFLFLKGIKKNIFFPYQLATTSSTQHHKLKEKMERNLFAGSFHCVKI